MIHVITVGENSPTQKPLSLGEDLHAKVHSLSAPKDSTVNHRMEEGLLLYINERSPTLPGSGDLEPVSDIQGKTIALKESLRESPQSPDVWVVVDFDDVLNRTTDFNRDLHVQIAEKLDMEVLAIEKLYDGAKVENEGGKRVFRFKKFIEDVKKEAEKQGKSPQIIDTILEGIDYAKYIHTGIKRSIVALQAHGLSNIKISLLTYGDPEYQKMRVHKAGVQNFVHEAIYTEGSKKDVVEAIMREGTHPGTTIFTFDDSPEHVDGYDKLDSNLPHVNIRVNNASAKRRNIPHTSNDVVVVNETSLNSGAVDLWKQAIAAMMAASNGKPMTRHELFSSLQSGEWQEIQGHLRTNGGTKMAYNLHHPEYGDAQCAFDLQGLSTNPHWLANKPPRILAPANSDGSFNRANLANALNIEEFITSQ